MRISLVILSAVLSAVMLLAVAGSADEADPNATATPAPPATIPEGDRAPEPTAAPPAVPATAAPAPAGGTSGTVKLAIDVSGDALQFSSTSMTAAAGSEVVVTFNNSSSVNSHNWALVEAGTKDAVATDGLAAGQDNHWLPVGDARVFGATTLIGPGESTDAEFTAPDAGNYQFVCTFPGHNFTMFGDFIVN